MHHTLLLFVAVTCQMFIQVFIFCYFKIQLHSYLQVINIIKYLKLGTINGNTISNTIKSMISMTVYSCMFTNINMLKQT